MRFVDEILEQYFSRLEPRLSAYARRYSDHLNARGAMPSWRNRHRLASIQAGRQLRVAILIVF
jgi:hypothetical protein